VPRDQTRALALFDRACIPGRERMHASCICTNTSVAKIAQARCRKGCELGDAGACRRAN